MSDRKTPAPDASHDAAHVSNFIRNIVDADLAANRYATAPLGRRARRCRAPCRRRGRPGEDPHALSARAQRLPALRPRQVDLPQLRPGARLRRRLPPALRRHQPGEGGAGVRRFDHRRGELARLRLGGFRPDASVLRQRLLRLHVPGGRVPDRSGPRLRRPAKRRGNARQSRHADRTRARIQPWRDRPRRGILRPVPAKCATGKHADGSMVLRAKIDMASPNINLRDPAIYRIKHADAPPHRRRLVHLPDVHLRAPDRGCAGADHALDLHARVRGPAAVLRLAARAPGRRRPAGAARCRSRSSSRASI